jgi:hypothetical protein
LIRHARPCAGHPRLWLGAKKDVDGRAFAAPKGLRPRRRDKPGHDEKGCADLRGYVAFDALVAVYFLL